MRYQEADYFDRTAALCLEAGFTPDIRHEAGQFVNVLALVACGLGVAIVPASFATLPFGRVVFRRLEASRYKSQLVILRAAAADAGRLVFTGDPTGGGRA
ncbi:LysR substrate-binding domain-containing protein [Polaromonas sp. P1(28)-13]|nr:LysR substrate-binding domain-containing protein [Polaromonas sp. P1(28)-13]